ncbi:hypothetical protein EDB87DRAFT_1686576 [Lactarius vividus]|nr:hypothetical protein EDB87DRAFT_1686576 [Lactarius vividus]
MVWDHDRAEHSHPPLSLWCWGLDDTPRLAITSACPSLPLASSDMLFPKLPFELPSLPAIEMSPVPEMIFLGTVKGVLSFVINLSLLDLSLIFIIVLLVNANPSIRQKAAVSLSVLFLVFGLEISLVNVYALLSPSITLEPLTIVIMGILNGVMPILTDSILLMHIVLESIEHSKSPWRLAMTMAAPIFLKFGRLANAGIYIAACAEFVLSSVTSGDGIPDMDILNAAQARSMQIACTLQMIDNSYQLALYYLNAFEQRRAELEGLAQSATSTTPQGLVALLLASGGNFLLPILLGAAQLEASRRWPDSDIPRDLEQVKVIVNIAGAATTSIVAALKHWRSARMAAALALRDAAMAIEANETTALRAGQKQPSYSGASMKRAEAGGRRYVTFDAELIDIDMKEDQAQMSLVLPVL